MERKTAGVAMTLQDIVLCACTVVLAILVGHKKGHDAGWEKGVEFMKRLRDSF